MRPSYQFEYFGKLHEKPFCCVLGGVTVGTNNWLDTIFFPSFLCQLLTMIWAGEIRKQNSHGVDSHSSLNTEWNGDHDISKIFKPIAILCAPINTLVVKPFEVGMKKKANTGLHVEQNSTA